MENDIPVFTISLLNDIFPASKNCKIVPKLESARFHAIEERKKLSDEDENLLEEHDQFYRDHKLLLSLFRYMGVMPVKRGIGRISFHWCSSTVIYAVFLYIITSCFVLSIGYERLQILSNNERFDEYIYYIIFIIFLVPHFWIPFVGWGIAKDVVVYKNFWGIFQLRYYRITGKDMKFPHLSTLIVIISIGCLLAAVVFLLALSTLLAGFTLWHTTAYYHIVTMLNMNGALWYINSRAIGNASDELANSFAEEIEKGATAYIISYYRHLWLDLSELLQKLGSAYTITYSVYSLFLIVNITIAAYGYLSEVIDNGFGFSFKEIGLLVDIMYSMFLLYVFCDCAHQASIKVAKRVQDILLGINLQQVEPLTIKEIQMFLAAIEMNPPTVSLKGYGDVNRRLLTSSFTTIAIYLIVLVQFKISLPKEK